MALSLSMIAVSMIVGNHCVPVWKHQNMICNASGSVNFLLGMDVDMQDKYLICISYGDHGYWVVT